MNRNLKHLIKKQRKQYRKQVFMGFFRAKLKEQREFNEIATGALLSTKVGPFMMALGSLDIADHLVQFEAVDYACAEMAKRGLL